MGNVSLFRWLSTARQYSFLFFLAMTVGAGLITGMLGVATLASVLIALISR
ncbi:hypothetical protein [Pantoea sp. GL120224-02]|uniref:hypothetical protein n=1 Tax=Pantoea sp. GL120224-02 TaxID=1378084 RepID=UPI000BD3C9D9|nr:hypothetical protein [Pantoea sp. GL120224-02]SNY71050.1 hypothetical protein SAMN02744778_03135 [Pantoea sp. GL120224-02]